MASTNTPDTSPNTVLLDPLPDSLCCYSSVFHSFGILEHILTYSDLNTVLSATAVNRRWKEAGRQDEIWRNFVSKLWEGKKGTHHCGLNHLHKEPLFWRSLFSNDAVSRMSELQIRSIFDHHLLVEKRAKIRDCNNIIELRRFLQVHMLDIISGYEDLAHPKQDLFFSDLYFGSYAHSIIDSTRDKITQAELCVKHGFNMFFKILQEDVEEADRQHLLAYKDGILLYPYSTAFFEDSRAFRIDVDQIPQSYHPANLKWTWIEVGKQVQVGPYPPLTASRSDDWGWKLENLHVVLIFRDC